MLLIADGAVLLLHGVDPGAPDAGSWWITPGGGAAAGEPLEVAAAREVFEETGLALEPSDLGPVVATRVAQFVFEGRTYRQSESFFAVRVPHFEPVADGWEEAEVRSLLEQRWWTVDELAHTDAVVYPKELPALVRTVADGPPDEPIELSGE